MLPCAIVPFQAKFQSAEGTLQVNNSYFSPSGSYLQISPVSSAPAQVRLSLYPIVIWHNHNFKNMFNPDF